MNILPVSVSTVTKAVERRLQLDERLADVNIERSAEINEIPSRCPWVGVYRAECAFPHRALGTGITGWRGQRVNVAILVQDSDPKAGDACEDRVNELVDKVLSVLLSDTTLGGAVQALDEVTVRYPDYRRVSDGPYMQTAMIFFTAITMVGGIQP